MSIQVTNLVKRHDNHLTVVDNVSFHIKEGEMVGLLGPSGSGKTTLLRMIAGLERQTSGEIWIRGQNVDALPPQRRGVGFVFQNYALFQHMTVFDNIAFGLRIKRLGAAEIRKRVAHLLELVRLTGYEQRYPRQLSGGQAQRVALARALAPEPSVLLLDEPFSAVDTKIRKELRQWVRQIHDEVGITSIFVTHDQEEALEIADRVLVMHQGRIEQFGTPQEIWENPATPFVASFIGDVNEFVAEVTGGSVMLGRLRLPTPDFADGERVRILIRPSDILLSPPTADSSPVAYVHQVAWKGLTYNARIEVEHGPVLQVSVPADNRSLLTPGNLVAFQVTRFRAFRD
jgi:sulfate transport system ATP-binding protein